MSAKLNTREARMCESVLFALVDMGKLSREKFEELKNKIREMAEESATKEPEQKTA